MTRERKITFFYDVAKICRNVEDITSALGARVQDNEGNSQIDNIAMSEDDMILAHRFAHDAMTELRKKLLAWSVYETDTEQGREHITLILPIGNEADSVLDRQIMEYLSDYVASSWLITKGIQDYRLYAEKAKNDLDNILSIVISYGARRYRRKLFM